MSADGEMDDKAKFFCRLCFDLKRFGVTWIRHDGNYHQISVKVRLPDVPGVLQTVGLFYLENDELHIHYDWPDTSTGELGLWRHEDVSVMLADYDPDEHPKKIAAVVKEKQKAWRAWRKDYLGWLSKQKARKKPR